MTFSTIINMIAGMAILLLGSWLGMINLGVSLVCGIICLIEDADEADERDLEFECDLHRTLK